MLVVGPPPFLGQPDRLAISLAQLCSGTLGGKLAPKTAARRWGHAALAPRQIRGTITVDGDDQPIESILNGVAADAIKLGTASTRAEELGTCERREDCQRLRIS